MILYFWISISMHVIAFCLTSHFINCLSCQFLLVIIPSLLVTTILVTVLGIVVNRVANVTNSYRWIRRRVACGSILDSLQKMATSQRKTKGKKRSLLQTVPKENKLPGKHNQHDGALAV